MSTSYVKIRRPALLTLALCPDVGVDVSHFVPACLSWWVSKYSRYVLQRLQQQRHCHRCRAEDAMFPREGFPSLSRSRRLGTEWNRREAQRLQSRSRRLQMRIDRSGLTTRGRLRPTPWSRFDLRRGKKVKETAAMEGTGALAGLASTSKSRIFWEVAFPWKPLVPRAPLRQPRSACEPGGDTRSTGPRSGGGEACCRRRCLVNGLHVEE